MILPEIGLGGFPHDTICAMAILPPGVRRTPLLDSGEWLLRTKKVLSEPFKKISRNRETLKSTIPLYGSRRPAITNEKAEADRTKQTKHQEIVVQ
jgi:hypothetical protein